MSRKPIEKEQEALPHGEIPCGSACLAVHPVCREGGR